MTKRSEKNYEDAVNRWTHKGDQAWAKAKNEEGGHHFSKAKQYYDNAKSNKSKLDELKRNK